MDRSSQNPYSKVPLPLPTRTELKEESDRRYDFHKASKRVLRYPYGDMSEKDILQHIRNVCGLHCLELHDMQIIIYRLNKYGKNIRSSIPIPQE